MAFKKGYTPWNKGKKMPPDAIMRGALLRTGVKIPSLLGNSNASGAHISVRDEKNVMWKGDEAGYSAIHKWVIVRLGKPLRCDICGINNKKSYDWASLSHKYLRDLSDWIRVCRRCHRKYDMQNNNYRVAYLDKE